MDRIRITKKPPPRRASFLNDLFTNGGDFLWKTSVPFRYSSVTTKSPEGTHRRLSNITVSTVRKMCACNTAQPFDLRPLSSWQGGFPAPVASPRPRALPVDPPPLRGVYALLPLGPGHGTMAGALCAVVPPWTPRPREPIALPLDAHRPGFRSHGPRQREFAPWHCPPPLAFSRRPRGCKPRR